MKSKMKWILVPLLVFSMSTVSIAAEFKSFKDLGISTMLIQPTSDDYRIDSLKEDPKAPGLIIFSVHSKYADYKVEGLVELRKLLHEIEAIKVLESQTTGGGVAKGAADSVKATGRGLKNLVVHPINSGKGLGKAAGKLGGKIGGLFQEKEQAEKVSMGESMLGSEKRKLAKEAGVDVYTRNAYLQERMTDIAKSRIGGQGAVMVVQFLLPVAALASFVLTASGINSAADQVINDNDRGDLYRLNETALKSLGYGEKTVKDFLALSFYNPRETTYFRFYLEELKNVAGVEQILNKALNVSSDAEAYQCLYEAQLAAEASKKFGDIKKVTVIPEGLALERPSQLIMVCAYDYLDASSFGSKIIDKAIALKVKSQKKSVAIYSGGRMAPAFTGLLMLRGIKGSDMLLFVPEKK